MARIFLLTTTDEHYCEMPFYGYVWLIRYSAHLSETNAMEVVDITSTEYAYHLRNNLSLEGLDSYDEHVHYTTNLISSVINFISQSLIPALSVEQQDLYEKFGGHEALVNFFSDDENNVFKNILTPDEPEDTESNPEVTLMLVNNFLSFLQHTQSINETPKVFID